MFCPAHFRQEEHGCPALLAGGVRRLQRAAGHGSFRDSSRELVEQARGFASRSLSFAILLGLILVFVAQIVIGIVYGLAAGIGTAAGADAVTGAIAAGPGIEGVLEKPWSPLTSILAHTTLLHLIVSCVFLYFLGPHVEQRLGRRNALLLFLAGGAAASVLQPALFGGYSVGPSGGLLALAGFLVVAAPRAQVFFFLMAMPAWLVVLLLLAVDLASTPGALASEGFTRIANLPHLAGFLLGALLAFRLRHPLPLPRIRQGALGRAL